MGPVDPRMHPPLPHTFVTPPPRADACVLGRRHLAASHGSGAGGQPAGGCAGGRVQHPGKFGLGGDEGCLYTTEAQSACMQLHVGVSGDVYCIFKCEVAWSIRALER